jgi:proline dehydrogenase
MNQVTDHLSFENTEIAFRHSSDADLKRAYWLFRVINVNFLVKIGPPITNFAVSIGLPIKGLIKKTIFQHFCGGETIRECETTIKSLNAGKVGTILDYSIEGEDDEQVFDSTAEEIIRTIRRAAKEPAIPITVFKITGVGRFGLLEKLDAKLPLNPAEEQEWKKVQARVLSIGQKAHGVSIPVMIDAEETWIQDTIDGLALNMMRKFNNERAIVYNTYQLYRHDKLQSLKNDHATAAKEGFILGAKLVRGAYMEKERRRQRTGITMPRCISALITSIRLPLLQAPITKIAAACWPNCWTKKASTTAIPTFTFRNCWA